MSLPIDENRILVLTPTGSDANNVLHLLLDDGLYALNCVNVVDLCQQIRRGASVVLIAEEALTLAELPELLELLSRQEPWSDLPIVVISGRGRYRGYSSLDVLGRSANVALLERPLSKVILLSAMQTGLRARQKQYEVRRLIEERERHVAALRQSEERLKIAVGAARLGIWELNLESNTLTCSDACKGIFGYRDDQEFNYIDFVRSIHPAARERVRTEILEAVNAKREFEAELRIVWPNGSEHFLLLSGAVLADAMTGISQLLLGVVLDVTARAEAEAERLRLLEREKAARAEAEAANRMKDEFLATVSHELRNPLNSILGFAQLLRRGNRSPEEVSKALDIIERNSRAQAALVNDLLDISRIVAGKLKLEAQKIELPEIIDAAIDATKIALDAKEVRVEKHYPSQALTVIGDANRMQQIIWNLLTNAVKFSKRGGLIRVILRELNGSAVLEVHDNGIGIHPEFLPYVFDRFRQERQMINRSAMGLGLGLSIVRHLVELQGGSVAAHSPGEGEGASFTVSFPLAPNRSAVEISAPPAAAVIPSYEELLASSVSLKGIRVLAVDDEADSRELIRTLLEECGAQAMTAGSATEGLQALADFCPDVLISDLGMPGEDGYAFIARVRALSSEAGGLVPAVALTAYSRSEDRALALQSGFQAHLSKPVTANELTATVARLARKKTTTSPALAVNV